MDHEVKAPGAPLTAHESHSYRVRGKMTVQDVAAFLAARMAEAPHLAACQVEEVKYAAPIDGSRSGFMATLASMADPALQDITIITISASPG